uniref:DNA methylase n=1 Tax=uncultured marine virus TaxID=186617 RepID=A0A0F7L6E8_9VIRU|nr:DNA methylase [uncultured marine virus]
MEESSLEADFIVGGVVAELGKDGGQVVPAVVVGLNADVPAGFSGGQALAGDSGAACPSIGFEDQFAGSAAGADDAVVEGEGLLAGMQCETVRPSEAVNARDLAMPPHVANADRVRKGWSACFVLGPQVVVLGPQVVVGGPQVVVGGQDEVAPLPRGSGRARLHRRGATLPHVPRWEVLAALPVRNAAREATRRTRECSRQVAAGHPRANSLLCQECSRRVALVAVGGFGDLRASAGVGRPLLALVVAARLRQGEPHPHSGSVDLAGHAGDPLVPRDATTERPPRSPHGSTQIALALISPPDIHGGRRSARNAPRLDVWAVPLGQVSGLHLVPVHAHAHGIGAVRDDQ